MTKKNCNTGKCNIKKSPANGKGDSPRSNHSKKFQKNYDKINWTKKNK